MTPGSINSNNIDQCEDDALSEMSTQKLARKAQRGSAEAFEVLMGRHMAALEHYLAKRCPRSQDADDLRQETMLKVWRNIDKYDTTRPFAPWLFAVARNITINSLKAMKRGLEKPLCLHDHEWAGKAPAADMMQQELAQGIWSEAREVLSDHQYTALWLRHAQDMTVKQIAHTLGMSETHVKVTLFRARKVLTRRWKSHPPLQGE